MEEDESVERREDDKTWNSKWYLICKKVFFINKKN